MDEVGNISLALHLSPWLPFDGLLSFSLFTSFSQLDLTPYTLFFATFFSSFFVLVIPLA
jgi:hypothetical protein